MTTTAATSTKLTMRPVSLPNNYRLIYAAIPKDVDKNVNLNSLEEEFDNLISLGQFFESHRKEVKELKHKVSYCFKKFLFFNAKRFLFIHFHLHPASSYRGAE